MRDPRRSEHRSRWVWVLVLFCASAAAEYQKGLDAFLEGDYEKAMTEWKEQVNRPGEPDNLAIHRETLYAIGMLYWHGYGVPQDYAIAAVWLRRAADINHAGAQVKMGYLHVTGQGVPQSYPEARRWFERAAAQGDVDARHNLDVMFEKGLLTPPPMEEEPGIGVAPISVGAVEETLPAQGLAVATASGVPTEQVLDSAVAPGPVPKVASASESDGETDDTPPVAAVAQPSAPEPPLDRGPDWILAQDPEQFTIQVIALREQEKLRDFIADHADWAPFAIFRPAGNERPLWVLVQGVYADVESARAARDEFPTGLQPRRNLWIRKFGMVQRQVE